MYQNSTAMRKWTKQTKKIVFGLIEFKLALRGRNQNREKTKTEKTLETGIQPEG